MDDPLTCCLWRATLMFVGVNTKTNTNRKQMLGRLLLYCIVSNLSCLECQTEGDAESIEIHDFYILVKHKHGNVLHYYASNSMFFKQMLSNTTSYIVVHFLKMVFVSYIKILAEEGKGFRQFREKIFKK